jgi:hypothetical protein
LAAVKNDGCTIQYIKNPSLEVQLEAVKHSFFALECIDNPYEEVQIEAVKQNKKALQYITDYNIIKKLRPYWSEYINLSKLTKEQHEEIVEEMQTLELFK